MASGAVNPKLAGAPELVFRWRQPKSTWVPKLLAVAFAGVAFAFLMTVKIRMVELEKSAPRRAAVIYLRDDELGRAMTLRAQEGGPFPAKFQLSQWEGLAALENSALEDARFPPEPYVPPLQELPAANQLRSQELAAKGQSFFPPHAPVPADAPVGAKLKRAPVLYPLSGISHGDLPRDLPAFDTVMDAATASPSWRFPPRRFLVRLNPEGGVVESVAMDPSGHAGTPALEAWLHEIQFKPEPAKPFRWIAVGVGFTNQPVDGTNAR
jgi:hypothetical protein